MNVDFSTLAIEVANHHGCHTMILYGSYARGDHGPESDLDLAGFRDTAEPTHDCRRVGDVVLDAWIHPAKEAGEPSAFLRLRGGRVLVEHDGFGATLLERIETVYRAGPPALSSSERETRRVWAEKMLLRAGRGDVEGNYRRAWLLYALLEDYFALRRRWFEGPKASVAWLAEHRPSVHQQLEAALAPGAPLSALAALAKLVHTGDDS